MSNSNYEAAKAYQQRGWAVIPATGKIPAVRWKLYQSMLPDDDDIEEWFGPGGKFVDSNIGIVTGQISRNIVLDFDHTDAIKAFRERNNGERLRCPQVISGKGLHAYLNYPAGLTTLLDNDRIQNFVGKLASIDSRFKHLDLRADGGFVVTPPSTHASGKKYEWAISPEECGPPDVPDWFLRVLLDASATETPKAQNNTATDEIDLFGNDYAKLLDGVGHGQRNDACAKLAGHYFSMGLPHREVLPILIGWNQRNDPPMTQAEVLATVKSIYDRDQKRRENELNEVPEAIRFTDGWNAKRFVADYGENIRYVADWNKWLIWDKTRYQVDRKLWAQRLAKETVKKMLVDAAKAQDDDERKARVKHAIRSDAAHKYNAMVDLARSEPNIPVQADELDKDPMLLNVENGTIDLTTGKIMSHTRRNLITKLAPVEYDPQAVCPFWLHSLNLYMDGDEDLIRFLQRAIGYSITGLIQDQVLLICYGSGANGKSAFLETILGMLGDYAKPSEPDLLIKRRHDNHPTGIADLMGRRFVSTTEIGEGVRLNEPLVKRLTGSDTLTARFMRQDYFDFEPTHKLWIGVNHKPIIRGTDTGIWRRIRLIPFNVNLEERLAADVRPISVVLSELRTEWPGILNWAIQGCLEWQRDGLGMPSPVADATKEYQADMDIVGRFIEECCILGDEYQASAKDLYQKYKFWCEDNGEYAISKKVFGGKLGEKGLESGRKHGGVRIWKNIGIRENGDALVTDGDVSSEGVKANEGAALSAMELL
jgi:putative DNA primase/helicase